MASVIYLLFAERDGHFWVLAVAHGARQPVAVQHAREPVDAHINVQLVLLEFGLRSISSQIIMMRALRPVSAGFTAGLLACIKLTCRHM